MAYQLEQIDYDLERISDVISLIQSEGHINDSEAISTLGTIKESIINLMHENDELKRQIKELETEVKRLKESRKSVVVGQIAAKFEKILIGCILQDCSLPLERRGYLTINQIGNALKRNSAYYESEGIFQSDLEVERARGRWRELAKIHNLTFHDYGAIRKLKDSRNDDAHPNMSIEEAERFIKTNCDTDREILLKFVGILKQYKVQNIGTYAQNN